MSEIKTWRERMKPEYHDIAAMAGKYMQAEIDDLRAALAERDAKLSALEKQEPVDAVAVEDMDAGTDWRYGRVLMATENCIKQLYAAAGAAPVPIEYTPGKWFKAQGLDQMQEFYRSRLPAIREAAREHGYAIGVHGSERRDFDLIAMQWREGASDRDTLAEAIQVAACGLGLNGKRQWEQKPSGRVATSMPICWTDYQKDGAGHIDLSLITAAGAAPVPTGLIEVLKEAAEILNDLTPETAPPSHRWPIVDELDGFALMLAAAPKEPTP